MAKLKSVLSLLIVGMMIMISNSCSVDNPVINLPDENVGASENGDLEVFVRQKTAIGEYIGNALVKLYYTESDWTNNASFRVNTTDAVDPTKKGAMFDNLAFQRYWMSCEFNMLGVDYIGADNTLVPLGVTTQFHLVCPEK